MVVQVPASAPAFTGPQLSRLALGLAGLGYQPEDAWVRCLQVRAAAGWRARCGRGGGGGEDVG